MSGSLDGTTFTTLNAAASYVFDPATGNTVTITFPANTGWPAGQCSEFEVYAARRAGTTRTRKARVSHRASECRVR